MEISLDWQTALNLSIGSLVTLFVAALYFYWQQKLSMKEIVGLFGKIQSGLGQVLESGKYLDLQNVLHQLGKLEASIEHLKESVSSITRSVTDETKFQQEALLKELQAQHIKHARDSRDFVVLAIRKELERAELVDEKKLDSVVQQLADNLEAAVITMSKHLEANYSENTKQALTSVERTVRISMQQVLSAVSGFEQEVSGLPIVRDAWERDGRSDQRGY
jgi:ABC-type multidrug transport system fused ATPase/permease subunit